MRIRIVAALAGAFVLASQVVHAGPKEEVAAATAAWGESFAMNDADKVASLYAADAVLWGTSSPKIRADQAAVRDYFVGAFKAVPGLKASFGEQLIRVYGDTAVNTGSYTFSYPKGSETITLPARYSLVFIKKGDTWKIVDHHSSAMPAPPR